MMQNLTFFRQGTEEQLGNKMKKAVNGYKTRYRIARWLNIAENELNALRFNV